MSSKLWGLAGVSAVALSLSGCVVAPVVAVPGQGKTYAQFQADDAACRGAGSGTQTTVTPEAQAAYLQCMTVRGNTAASVPRTYPYPAYSYGYYYPWLYPYSYPYWGGAYGYGPWWGPGVAIGFGFGPGPFRGPGFGPGGFGPGGFRGGPGGFGGPGGGPGGFGRGPGGGFGGGGPGGGGGGGHR